MLEKFLYSLKEFSTDVLNLAIAVALVVVIFVVFGKVGKRSLARWGIDPGPGILLFWLILCGVFGAVILYRSCS